MWQDEKGLLLHKKRVHRHFITLIWAPRGCSVTRPNRPKNQNHWQKLETGGLVFGNYFPPTWMSPLATSHSRTNVRKWSRRFWREINVDGRWMKDGGVTGNTGPAQNNRVGPGARLGRLAAVERSWTSSDWFRTIRGSGRGAATHLFLTKRMATSTSSIKTRTPALIPAIFTTRSVCLAGSGMTSGSSVAPIDIVKRHMNTALAHSELVIKRAYSTRFTWQEM